MDEEVSKVKFERAVQVFDPDHERFVSVEGWEVLTRDYPHLRIVFKHPASKRRFGFDFMCDEWDHLPPSLSLFDPVGGDELPWPKWPQGGWQAGEHPVTRRPFLCLPGIREYHTHTSHLNDPWDNYRNRSSYGLGHIVDRVWQKFGVTNG